MVRVHRGSAAYEFACHAAECRPPTSGGTGGSSITVKVPGGSGRIAAFKGKSHYTTTVSEGHDVHGQALNPMGAVRAIERLHNPTSTGTVPKRSRAEMPQIPAAKQAEFDKFLAKEGVSSWDVRVSPKKLKPTQSQFNQAKVEQMIKSGSHKAKDKVINVSHDWMILDGHHRWKANMQQHALRMTVRRYSAPMAHLIRLADKFVKEQNIPARSVEQLGLIQSCYEFGGEEFYAATQPRDKNGMWTNGGGGGSAALLARVKARAAGATHLAETSPHYQTRGSDVMPMSEGEARKLVMDKDATGRRVLGKGHEIADGQVVGVRANLNLKKTTGITIQTMHKGSQSQLDKGTGLFGGEAIGYQAAVTLRNVNFSVNQAARAAIAEKRENKFPMASVDGHYVKAPDESTRFDGIEVRFNPMAQHLFVDPDGRAVKSASEATVVGSRVFVRGNVTYYTDANMPQNASTVASDAVAWNP